MSHIRDFQKLGPLIIGSKDLVYHTLVEVHICFGVKLDIISKSQRVAGINIIGSSDEDNYC